jgi:phage FluMu protein Com
MQTERRSESLDARPTERKWEEVRCRSCKRMLCKTTAQPLKPSEMIEIKCVKCDALNYLMGRPA